LVLAYEASFKPNFVINLYFGLTLVLLPNFSLKMLV